MSAPVTVEVGTTANGKPVTIVRYPTFDEVRIGDTSVGVHRYWEDAAAQAGQLVPRWSANWDRSGRSDSDESL
jgi:hypothetical protein